MNDEQFDELLTSVIDMAKHMRGESIDARVREFPEPDVNAIGNQTDLLLVDHVNPSHQTIDKALASTRCRSQIIMGFD